MQIAVALAIFLSVTPAAALAQQTRTLAAGAQSPAAKVSDLAWLVGEWTGKGFGAELYETYSTPVGGQMPGHFYIAKDGKPTMYEFVMIAEAGDSIEYRVRHFNPDMTAWEDKTSFVRFPLVAVEGDSWYFDGLTIRRTGHDTADHVVLIKQKDGKEAEELLQYRRIKKGGPAHQ